MLRGQLAGQHSGRIPMIMKNLKKESVASKRSERRSAVGIGRPPTELAGKVEERILDAARKVFLERGFEGASIEEIARAARSGKPTIYARFASKEALFNAVAMHDVVSRIEHFKGEVPTGATIEERLASLAIALLDWILASDRLALMRLAVAGIRRFPDLASSVSRTARELSAQVAAQHLSEITQSDELGALPAFAPEHLATTARFFLDLVVVPILLRALFEQRLETLRAEIGPHVTRSVAFFLAACRNGGVT